MTHSQFRGTHFGVQETENNPVRLFVRDMQLMQAQLITNNHQRCLISIQ